MVQPEEQPTSTGTKDCEEQTIHKIVDHKPQEYGTMLYKILFYSFGKDSDTL